MLAQVVTVRQHATAQERAQARAVAEKITVYYSDLDHCWYAASTSHPFTWHKVDPVAQKCACLAGQHGSYCKHLAAVQIARLRRCQFCGHVGDTVIRFYRVGGGEIAVAECKDQTGCKARQEA